MSVAGLCEICHDNTVEHTCGRCGSLVCDLHIDRRTELCVECAAEAGDTDRPGEGVPGPGDRYRS